MQVLIGCSGRKLHGKDTFARLVREGNNIFHINHFAGSLKAICAKVFGLAEAQMYDPVIKEQAFDTPVVMDNYLEALRAETGLDIQPAGKIARSPRELMQFVGTEYVRKAQDDYWIQRLISDTSTYSRVIVPDTRFPNEANAIRSVGGKIIKVVRIDMAIPENEHASESEIDKIDPDLLVGAVTGDLSLPQRVAMLVADGKFDSALRYDYRAATRALEKFEAGYDFRDCADLLPGLGDKGWAFHVILNYYRRGGLEALRVNPSGN